MLVTGGAGFIGSHIVDALLSKGYAVGALDNLSTGDALNIKQHQGESRFTFHNSDISDFGAMENVMKGYDAVIHEAALVSVARSVEDPLTVNAVNVGGTLNLLQAATNAGVERFVYASSSSVYGESETVPKSEEMRTLPASPYGAAKLAAENYCVAFAKVYGLHTISLRYFNVYGPRQKSGRYSGVIPVFIRRAFERQSPQIYGDGEQTRDFIHVEDVVQANLLALEKDTPKGEVLNIAAGIPVSVNKLASLILDITGSQNQRPEHLEPRAGDIRHSYADIGKAREVLGYTPKRALSDGLKTVVDWMRGQP